MEDGGRDLGTRGAAGVTKKREGTGACGAAGAAGEVQWGPNSFKQ